MSRVRTYLLVVVASALAGMIGAAFGTGTAQAVVSTLVSVVNPTTSPVASLNVTDPGRVAYQSSLSTSSCSALIECILKFPTVPSGHRVVIQHIGGYDAFNATPTALQSIVELDGTTIMSSFFMPTSNSLYAIDQPEMFYVDAGHHVELFLEIYGGNFSGIGNLTLTGYELDCTVAACAAIATQ